ncbi:hypothetical protein J4G37_24485 [Microvirga sp. 3-52]|nr:hypothetical protein [Microvirga sp. 3-52]
MHFILLMLPPPKPRSNQVRAFQRSRSDIGCEFQGTSRGDINADNPDWAKGAS